MSSDESVKIFLQTEGYARFRPPLGMTRERYGQYRHAVEGARYIRQLRATLTPIDKVSAIIIRLRDAGFGVDAKPELVRILQERTAQQWLDLKSAQERIARIDDELFKQAGARLFPFQHTGALWLTLKHGALLADDQGTGKTLQTIVALPANVPALVVAPAVAKGVWKGEIRKWRPHIRVATLEGRDSFRWPRSGELLVMNYDILPNIHDRQGVAGRKCNGFFDPQPCPGCAEKLVFIGPIASIDRTGHLEKCGGFLPPAMCPGCHPFLKQAPANMVLIADEAQYLKTAKAKRTQSFRALSEAVRADEGRVWLLSGTPLENEPKELWAVFKAAGIAEDAFGSWDGFVELFKGKKLKYGYEWGVPDKDGDIRDRLQRVTLRRMKVDVLPQLPAKMWQQHEVELDSKTIRACESFLRQSGRTVPQIVEMLEKDTVEGGLGFMATIRALLAAAKIPAMTAVVKDFEDRGEPLVVFSAHRAPIDTLAKRPGWAVITGDMTANKKREIEERFQAGEFKGLGITIRSGGVSITLTRACHELFVDLDWTPAKNVQAEDRCSRIGQTRGVIIMRLIADHPLDARVMEVLARKMRLISASVDTAAVADDAPIPGADAQSEASKAFEDQLHRIQEEIACGRAVRRMGESIEEKAALDALHTLIFASPTDERIGLELAQEAQVIGLSKAQWDLAIRIAMRGKPPLVEDESTSVARPGLESGEPELEEDTSAEAEEEAPLSAGSDESDEPQPLTRSKKGWADRRLFRQQRGGD